MSSTETQIIEGLKEHLRVQFKDERRGTRSIMTGESHSCVETHLEEVPRLAAETLRRVSEVNPQILTGVDPFLIDVIARSHDLLEDGYAKGCPIGCQKKPTCPDHYEKMARDTRAKLMELGLSEHDAEFCVAKIRALSKDFSLPKPERNAGLYERLRREPLEVKCIKLGDNWHNLQTLSGRGFLRAVRNYVRVRESWPRVFSEEELETLGETGLVEEPDRMKARSFLFSQLFAAVQQRGDLPNLWLPMGDSGSPMANPLKEYENEIRRMAEQLICLSEHEGAERKLENICMPAISRGLGPEIPLAGEEQIILARMMESERLYTLRFLGSGGLESLKKKLRELAQEDKRISTGHSDPLRRGMPERERVLMFLDSVGLTGRALIELNDESEFRRIVAEAIVREQGRGRA